MVHDRANWRNANAPYGIGADRGRMRVCLPWHSGGSRAKRHALAEPQHSVADADHQSDRAPRINPTIAVRPVTGIPAGVTSARIGAKLPEAHFSPNLSPACSYAHRDSSGECKEKPVSSSDGGGAGKSAKNGKNGGASRNSPLAVLNPAAIANEFVAEIDGSLSDAQADALARRHGLVRVQSQNFPLLGATIGLFRITDRRPVEQARRTFAGEAGVRFGAAEFPPFSAGAEGRRRPRAIPRNTRWPSFGCRRPIRWPAAPT